MNAGGTPIPIKIDEKFYGLSPESLTSRIDESTGAVVVIHIAGLITPRIEEIRLICDEHNVPLIEDCAQAFGSEFRNVKVGNFGVSGSFSF